MDVRMEVLPLDALRPHPSNSNVMPGKAFAKLKAHLAANGRYPPLVVRPLDESAGAYQLLDGHHRAAALRELGHETAQCAVWGVDEDEALVLLATLNRLRGRDDPRKRAKLLRELSARFGRRALTAKLPEPPEKLNALLAMSDSVSTPRAPQRLADMPTAVQFFLNPEEKRRLERRLRELGGTREEALMLLVG